MSKQGVMMLGIGDLGASKTPGETVKTMALGSCLAVICLDPAQRCVGMVHVALPDSSVNSSRRRDRPGYFADTGIPALLEEMTRLGCGADRRKWLVKLVGGANVADASNTFNIGKRNAMAIKKILWAVGLVPKAEDIGENFSRTVEVAVATGRVTVTSPGRGEWNL